MMANILSKRSYWLRVLFFKTSLKRGWESNTHPKTNHNVKKASKRKGEAKISISWCQL